MAMETQDIIKRSATNPITPAPRARDYKAEVAKLIDVSSCVRQPGGSQRQILDGNAF